MARAPQLQISDFKPPPPVQDSGELVRLGDKYDDAPPGMEDIQLTPAEAKRLMKSLRKQAKGYVSKYIPMICQGLRCPLADRCPIMQEFPNAVPVGKLCPIESMTVDHLVKELSATIKAQLGEGFDFIVASMIDEYVAATILEMRIAGDIAKNGHITKTPVVIQGGREVITKDDLSPSAEFLLKIQTTKRKILEALVATPEAKLSAGITEVRDQSVAQAETRKKVELLEALEMKISETDEEGVATYEVDDAAGK